jgi:transcriptional regulator with XRE-family HTH domain
VFRFEQLPEYTQFRLARVAAGLTLFELGRRASVSPPRLSEFERGHVALPAKVLASLELILRDGLRSATCRGRESEDTGQSTPTWIQKQLTGAFGDGAEAELQ